jgi:maleate isomerase
MAPARIGLLVPSSNTCLEPVAEALLPADVSLHVNRVPVTRIDLDEAGVAQFDHAPMLEAARVLADARVRVLAWGGTSGSWLGIEHDRELCRLLESDLRIPVTTSTFALLDALEVYGVRRYGLAVPYTADVAERIVETYGSVGLECVGWADLGISDNFRFGEVRPNEIKAMVADTAPGAEAVATVCTNLPAAPLVEELEQSGPFVVDSVVATVWKCLELSGRPLAIDGWGDLARNGSLRRALRDVLRDLLEATGASRTTIRLDLPDRGFDVDRAVAEAAGPGVTSILHDASLDQWAMPTVQWIAARKEMLVQEDFSGAPQVSPELVEVYGVKAQMLQPLLAGVLYGWISVHQVGYAREWSNEDRAALSQAAAAVETILGK